MSVLTPVDFFSLVGFAYFIVGVSLLAFFIRRLVGAEIPETSHEHLQGQPPSLVSATSPMSKWGLMT